MAAIRTLIGVLLFSPLVSAQTVLFDNGSTLPGSGAYGIVTATGIGAGGADVSAYASGGTIGFGLGTTATFQVRLADQFTVPVGEVWNVSAIRVYPFQSGAVTNPVSRGVLQIWNGSPLEPTSGILTGDLTNNVLAGSTDTGLYRVSQSAPTNTTRKIWETTLQTPANTVLSEGTYWIDFSLSFANGGNGFTPPLTMPGADVPTGDALIYSTTVNFWSPIYNLNDPLSVKGIPFQVVGENIVPEPVLLGFIPAILGVWTAFGIRKRERRGQ